MKPGRALILGVGRQGGAVPAALHLARQGWELRLSDRADAPSLRASIDRIETAGTALEWHLGTAQEPPDEFLDGCDLVVVNPAVPDDHPVLRRAAERGIARTQELDLALAAFPGRVVFVTGTNGKSTTSTLLHKALAATGVDARLVGNIGRSLLLDCADSTAATVAVLEVSSFQLERLDPQIQVESAVLTRIGADHLDRHGTIERYHAAKSRAARAATRLVARFADDAAAQSFETRSSARVLDVETSTESESGWIHAPNGERIVHRDALLGIGRAFADNAALAASTACALGASRAVVGTTLATASPPEFRLQEIRQPGPVRVFDNSVSTDAESTRAALHTLTSELSMHVQWIGGGKSKNRDLDTVAARLCSGVPVAQVRADLFGADATELARALAKQGIVARVHARVEEAVEAGWRDVASARRPNTAVLFSPACASFDQYANFRERAAAFHRQLAVLSGARRTTQPNPGSTSA